MKIPSRVLPSWTSPGYAKLRIAGGTPRRAILQYRTVDRDLALYNPGLSLRARKEDLFTQLLFYYKLNPETVLFLGYSDRSLGNESIDLSQANRTLFLKVGYAWLR